MPLDALYEALSTSIGASEGAATAPEATAALAEEAQTPEASPEAATEGATEDVAQPPAQVDRPRAPDGKFAKAGATPPAAPAAPPPQRPGPGAPAVPAAPPAPASPAPRTWAPAAREKWGQLPREVKDQVLKMEGLASRAHQELQQVKQQHQQFQEALQPFMPHWQALGVRPESAIRELAQAEYILRSGAPAEKTGLIAHLMQRAGVTPDALATVLEGRQLPQGAAPQELRDPRFDTFLGQIQQVATRRQEATAASAMQELGAFQATAPEFLDDVAEDMADLIASSRKRGKAMPLQQAYDKACQLNDNVRTVLEQRRAQEAQRAQQQKSQQARYAAGSIQSEPAPLAGGRKPGIGGMWDALRQNIEG